MKNSEAIRILSDVTLCSPLGQAAFVGVEAIKKLRQYRAIGTVEEFREAMEKQKGKNPIRVDAGNNGSSTDGCPVCKREFYEKFNFCPDCGTALDWNE